MTKLNKNVNMLENMTGPIRHTVPWLYGTVKFRTDHLIYVPM